MVSQWKWREGQDEMKKTWKRNDWNLRYNNTVFFYKNRLFFVHPTLQDIKDKTSKGDIEFRQSNKLMRKDGLHFRHQTAYWNHVDNLYEIFRFQYQAPPANLSSSRSHDVSCCISVSLFAFLLIYQFILGCLSDWLCKCLCDCLLDFLSDCLFYRLSYFYFLLSVCLTVPLCLCLCLSLSPPLHTIRFLHTFPHFSFPHQNRWQWCRKRAVKGKYHFYALLFFSILQKRKREIEVT